MTERAYYGITRSSDHLSHHGILGQKWGVRRFQNKDGSLTDAGRKRYGTASESTKASQDRLSKAVAKRGDNKVLNEAAERLSKDPRIQKALSNIENAREELKDYETGYNKEKARYKTIAGYAMSKRYGETTREDAERRAWSYLYDDGDDLDGNSFEYYLVGRREHPHSIAKKVHDVYENYEKARSDVAREALGHHADEKIALSSKTTKAEYLSYYINMKAGNGHVWDLLYGPWGMSRYPYTKYSAADVAEMREEVQRYKNVPIPPFNNY